MKNKKTLIFIVQSGLIAAVYVALTFVSALAGLASDAIQVRLSEALCVLPYFTPAAIPGLFIGCAMANLLTACARLCPFRHSFWVSGYAFRSAGGLPHWQIRKKM